MTKPYLGTARITRNAACAEGFYRMELEAPGLPAQAEPGQFVHLRLTAGTVPLLRRPFSICDYHADAGAPGRLEILYEVVGQGTTLMAGMAPGTELNLLGPQGRGYRLPPTDRVPLLVGGGVGIPPLYYLARRLIAAGHAPDRIQVLLGARTAAALCLEPEFRALGVRVGIATDDGSLGERGFVTALLERAVPGTGGRGEILTCGPMPMLHAIAALARRTGTACQISLENRMGCALGACRACVWPVKERGSDAWHYETVCREGPVFDLERLAGFPA